MSLTEDLEWAMEDELSMESMWDMLSGEFYPNNYSSLHRNPQLSNPDSSVPMYPFLSMQEDRVIYFALGEFSQGTSGGSFPTTVHLLAPGRYAARKSSLQTCSLHPNPRHEQLYWF
jgi:hypothetical protein